MGQELALLVARVPRNAGVQNEAASYSIQAEGVCADAGGVRWDCCCCSMGNWAQFLDSCGNPRRRSAREWTYCIRRR